MGGWNKPLEGLKLNSEETCHAVEFATSQEAWEKLNEGFLTLDPLLFSKGAVANAGVAVCYNVFIKIRRAWIDPEFDYGRHFNYTEAKWTVLLNNYIDFNQLDLIKSQLNVKKTTYNQNYNISYLFNNSHNNGKQCLLAATFSKRFQEDIPVVTVVLRASEITKRLIFDFLLVQRMAEYVYGKDQAVQINVFATQMYGNVETLLMYVAHKPFKDIFKGYDKKSSWYKRVKEVYNKFMDGTPEEFSKFKVYLRAFKVIRPDLYEYKPLLAKDLNLGDDTIEYPESCITFSQRKSYKRKLLKRKSAHKA
jgi:hypothetical protein